MMIKNCKWMFLALVVCFASCDPEEQVTDITQFPRIKIEDQSVNENSGAGEILVQLPTKDEVKTLKDYLAEELEYFQAAPEKADEYLAIGAYQAEYALEKPEMAAYAMVASAIFNLDESISRG